MIHGKMFPKIYIYNRFDRILRLPWNPLRAEYVIAIKKNAEPKVCYAITNMFITLLQIIIVEKNQTKIQKINVLKKECIITINCALDRYNNISSE